MAPEDGGPIGRNGACGSHGRCLGSATEGAEGAPRGAAPVQGAD